MENIKTGHFNGPRKNDVLRNVGEQTLGVSHKSIDFNTLEPSVKDKLIGDQVKLNHLREQRENTKN